MLFQRWENVSTVVLMSRVMPSMIIFFNWGLYYKVCWKWNYCIVVLNKQHFIKFCKGRQTTHFYKVVIVL